jgi:hypothetical protein
VGTISMSLRSNGIAARLLAGSIVAAGLGLLGADGFAQATSPFATLAGSWTGNGKITMATGASEPIRCRVTYDVEGDGGAMKQELRCASDSYKFELTSDVQYRNGVITGFWTERTRNTGGKLKGKVSGDRIQATVETPGFIAVLSLTTRGDRQEVNIKSPSTDIREITIGLKKG